MLGSARMKLRPRTPVQARRDRLQLKWMLALALALEVAMLVKVFCSCP
jgi:hypothetical protein